ncbi:MAG TPA: phage portal protein [Baekduia sp.]|uniref:phage portal protein n=1 Tax=Baekduia sp. TaxID=2600305 RepID=UPI002C47174B|nr:phage portal protein [Baekduia sp.]HMJ37143.1 phage portal protein [Baekduia sp.]
MDSIDLNKRRWPFGRRQVEDRALTRETVPGVFFPDTAAGVPVTERSAMSITDVFGCVGWLARTASTLPLHGYRRLEPTGRERVDAPLLETPAPGLTQSAFTAQCVQSLALWGETFVGLVHNGDEVAYLRTLRPDAVEVKIGSDGEPTYVWSIGDKRYELGREDVIHARLLSSLDGVRGMSPIAACREELGLSRALAGHASNTASAGYNPAGIVGLPETIGDAEGEEHAKEMQKRWDGRSATPNRIEFVTGEVTYTAVSTPARDAEFVAQRQLSTVAVCRIFGLFPWMIAAPSGDSNTYANVEGQAQAAITFSLSPYLVALEQAFTGHGTLLPPGRTYAQYVREALMQPDHAGRATFYTAALDEKHGWMTRAEVRDREDLPPEGATS